MKVNKLLCLVLFMILLFSGCSKPNTKLCHELQNHLSDCEPNPETVIELSAFTDFEWDKVLIYKNPVSAQEIYQMTGISYEPKDLCSGWVFFLENKVVYEEIFKTDFESLPSFFVYPCSNLNAEEKCTALTKENAFFVCEKYENDGKIGYALYPQNT